MPPATFPNNSPAIPPGGVHTARRPCDLSRVKQTLSPPQLLPFDGVRTAMPQGLSSLPGVAGNAHGFPSTVGIKLLLFHHSAAASTSGSSSNLSTTSSTVLAPSINSHLLLLCPVVTKLVAELGRAAVTVSRNIFCTFAMSPIPS